MKKIALTLGSLASVAAPVAAVVACGSEDHVDKFMTAKSFKDAFLKEAKIQNTSSLVPAGTTEYITKVSIKDTEARTFLAKVITLVDGSGGDKDVRAVLKTSLTLTEFTTAVNGLSNDNIKKQMLDVLDEAGNDAELVSAILAFTYTRLVNIEEGYIDLKTTTETDASLVVRTASATYLKSSVETVRNNILSTKLSAEAIAAAMISKYSTKASDTTSIYNKAVLDGVYTVSGVTITEATGSSPSLVIYGEQDAIKKIMEAANYTYIV